MSSEDMQIVYWTGGVLLAIVVVLAIAGYALGWFSAVPGPA